MNSKMVASSVETRANDYEDTCYYGLNYAPMSMLLRTYRKLDATKLAFDLDADFVENQLRNE